MQGQYDLAVIGAGPAGVAAAAEASRYGIHTLIVDEQPQAGGQVYRAPSPAIVEAAGSDGERLRRALEASGVDLALGKRLWFAAHGEGSFALRLAGDDGEVAVATRALILATGAQERVAPVPGWTLPGVIGLAAATALIKSEGVLPGREVVVAGRGPLLLLVAALILERGGRVAALVDANPARAWAGRPLAIASRPDLAWQGAAWLARVLRARTPIHFASAVRRMHGEARVTGVEIVRIASPEQVVARIDCDAVCAGDGLSPGTEVSRQLGATHAFDATLGGWHVSTDSDGRTDVPHLYACGDGAGVLGVAAAPLRGRLAARAAACDLGVAGADADARALRISLSRAARFGAAMSALAPADGSQVALAEPDTVICRCEAIPRGAIDAAIAAGSRTPNAVKSATRCGMGPCGGRYCADSVAALIAARTNRSLADVGMATGRPPVRPLPIGALTAGFDYDAIPFPEPAPL